MKHSITIFFLFISLGILNAQPKDGSSPLFNDPELGKTHFIVGLPPEQMIVKEKEVCQETELPGLLRCKDGSFKQALFSPDDNLQKMLVQLIDYEKEYILIAVFSFTDSVIANALINAKKRGVQVEIVTDISCVRDRFNKIDFLKENGIKVYIYNPRNMTVLNNIMHHKFVIFGKNIDGKPLLWTGSFNFTKSAQMNNQENVLIVDERHLIERYQKQFAILKERVARKVPQKLAHQKKRFITTIPS